MILRRCCLMLLAAVASASLDPLAPAHEQIEQKLVKRVPYGKLSPVPDYPELKYFQETPVNEHYDARFAKGFLKEDDQRSAIKVLIQTYLSVVQDLGIRTWLMHGTLLGWWWGKKVMPWDLDADVSIMESDMYYLAAYYNMTVFYYKYSGAKKGRYFLLEINPHFKHREQDDKLNFIDARWIDMNTGLYIDITAARYDPTHPAGEGMLFDKNGHEFRDTYLFPLRETTFEGMKAYIPFKYEAMLESEYGKRALTNKEFSDHTFIEDKMQWVINSDL